MADDFNKQRKHLDLDSLKTFFEYLKKYFGRVRTVNGVLPDPNTGDVLIDTKYELDINKIYPVGSVYLSVSAANPGALFPGTTWERIGGGRHLMGATDINRGGATGGSTNNTYKIPVPKHTHTATMSGTEGKHSHDRGTMNITGSTIASDDICPGNNSAYEQSYLNAHTGAFYYKQRSSDWRYADDRDGGSVAVIGFDASRDGAWTGRTSEEGEHTHSVTVETSGVDASITIDPAYLLVNIWKRVK